MFPGKFYESLKKKYRKIFSRKLFLPPCWGSMLSLLSGWGGKLHVSLHLSTRWMWVYWCHHIVCQHLCLLHGFCTHADCFSQLQMSPFTSSWQCKSLSHCGLTVWIIVPEIGSLGVVWLCRIFPWCNGHAGSATCKVRNRRGVWKTEVRFKILVVFSWSGLWPHKENGLPGGMWVSAALLLF